MNRLELLKNLVLCSIEDDEETLEHIFGELIYRFKPLYVFYDMLKEETVKVIKFEPPIIEDDEITFIFKIDNNERFKKYNNMKIKYKKTKLEYLVSYYYNKKENLTYVSLTKILT